MSFFFTNIKVFFKYEQQVSQKLKKKERTIVINDTHLMLRVLSLYCFVPASPSAVLLSKPWLVRGAFFCWIKNVSLLFFGQPRLSDPTDWSPILLYPVWALKISKSCKIVILIMIIKIMIIKMPLLLFNNNIYLKECKGLVSEFKSAWHFWTCTVASHAWYCLYLAKSVTSLRSGKRLKHGLDDLEKHQRSGENQAIIIIIIIIIIMITIWLW